MKILHINASARGTDSQSLLVAERLIATLQESSTATVDTIELFDGTLPPFDANAVGAKMALFTGANASDKQRETWEEVRLVFERFAEADTYVVNTPLWNNGIPYVLKQYIDLITQPGWTFGFDVEKGYSGLMTERRAFVIHASGVYYDGIKANFGSDFATPYLDDWFKFIGFSKVEHIHVAPTVVNANYQNTKDEAISQAVQAARSAIGAL